MSVAEETLALEAGDAPVEAPRPRGVSNVATGLLVAGDFMVLVGLIAGYYAVRAQSFEARPREISPGEFRAREIVPREV